MTTAEAQARPDAGLPGQARRRPGARMPRGRPEAGQPTAWRRWLVPVSLVTAIALAGGVIAAVTWHPRTNSYLDPGSSDPLGAGALNDLLGERGFSVVRAYSPEAAIAALGSPAPGKAQATLVVTSPEQLTPGQLRLLSKARADLFLVAPGPHSLPALAPQTTLATTGNTAKGPLAKPGCNLPAARLAGAADISGYTYQAPPGAIACYRAGGHPSLVRYAADGRTITILGGGILFSNAFLDSQGNAALALNLLRGHRQIVWLTPQPQVAPASPGPGGGSQRPVPPLLPAAAWLMIAQLCVALMIAVVWKARRFGPLITENLPVVVRASETVQGHARLYQSRRARAQATAALRSALLARVLPVLGVVRDAPPDSIAEVLAARSRKSQPEIARILYGPAPTDDPGLVDLARNLDELEREVRSQ